MTTLKQENNNKCIGIKRLCQCSSAMICWYNGIC